jgi:hypothetical protein
MILPVSLMCDRMQPWAAKCRSLCPIRAQVQDRQQGRGHISPDAALRRSGAWRVRPDLRRTWRRSVAARPHCARPTQPPGRVDAAVQPSGQTGVPKVVWPPCERRGLLCGTQSRLARFGPGALVGDGGQFAAPDTAEETAIGGSAELVKMRVQKPRQLGMGGHDAAVPSARCLSCRRSRGLPSSVHSLPASGVAPRTCSSPQSWSSVRPGGGRITLSTARLIASSGRSPA